MTAQARSRDLDTNNLVLLGNHLGKFVDLINSFVRTRCGVGHRGYHGGLLLGSIITKVDDAQTLFGDMASDIRSSCNKARLIDPEDALIPRLAKLQDGTAPLRSLGHKSAPAASSAVDKIDLAERGLKGMPVIFGKTEAAMVVVLREVGMLSNDLIIYLVYDDPGVN